MNWSMTAAERVAQVRTAAAGAVASYRDKVAFHIKNQNAGSLEAARRDLAHVEAEAKTLDSLSDLEVLNRAFEQAERERIAVNDRYMGLLVEQRKYGERVWAAAREEVKGHLDVSARHTVQRWIGDLTRILTAVEALDERANAERVAQLKQIAAGTRHEIALGKDRPDWVYEPTDHADKLNAVRHVVGTLTGRTNLDGTEVLRVVRAVLDGGHVGQIGLPGVGTIPGPEPLPFLGEHWREEPAFCAYEPPSGARVVAYNVGDAWHLDLHAATGALLAYGSADVTEVAEFAPALTARAAEWTADRSGYAWQRFAEIAEQRRRVAA